MVEDRDVILKVTGSTVCGSDLHLMHGSVVQMEKGDILGHEFCGKVDSMGPGVKGLKVGDRVVASFQIACGDVWNSRLLSNSRTDFGSAFTASRSCLLNARRRTPIPWNMEW